MSRHSTIGASCEVCDCVGGVENELKLHSVINFLKKLSIFTKVVEGLGTYNLMKWHISS